MAPLAPLPDLHHMSNARDAAIKARAGRLRKQLAGPFEPEPQPQPEPVTEPEPEPETAAAAVPDLADPLAVQHGAQQLPWQLSAEHYRFVHRGGQRAPAEVAVLLADAHRAALSHVVHIEIPAMCAAVQSQLQVPRLCNNSCALSSSCELVTS